MPAGGSTAIPLWSAIARRLRWRVVDQLGLSVAATMGGGKGADPKWGGRGETPQRKFARLSRQPARVVFTDSLSMMPAHGIGARHCRTRASLRSAALSHEHVTARDGRRRRAGGCGPGLVAGAGRGWPSLRP